MLVGFWFFVKWMDGQLLAPGPCPPQSVPPVPCLGIRAAQHPFVLWLGCWIAKCGVPPGLTPRAQACCWLGNGGAGRGEGRTGRTYPRSAGPPGTRPPAAQRRSRDSQAHSVDCLPNSAPSPAPSAGCPPTGKTEPTAQPQSPRFPLTHLQLPTSSLTSYRSPRLESRRPFLIGH